MDEQSTEENKIEETADIVEDNDAAEDTYTSPSSVISLATVANIIAWITLVVTLLLWVGYLALNFQAIQQLGLVTVYILGVSLPILLIGGFLFVILRAISESLYIMLDIQENTRRP